MENNFFQNSQLLAAEMKDVASMDLTARPFNRFAPSESVWWLIPSTEWPAFKFGKIFFRPFEDKYFCGFYLEKGVSISDQTLYNETMHLRPDWRWNNFVSALKQRDKNLMVLFKQLASKECSYHLNISFNALPLDNGDAYDTADSFLEQKKDFTPTEIDAKIGKDLRMTNIEITKNFAQTDLVKYLEGEKFNDADVFDIGGIMENAPKIEWLWVDLSFGIYVPKDQKDLSSSDLWVNYLEPWTPWLR